MAFLPAVAALAQIGFTIADALKSPPPPPLPPALSPNQFGIDNAAVGQELRRESTRRGRGSTISPILTGASELLETAEDASKLGTLLGG